jgi:pyruvate dehydrogenase E1 component
MTSTTLQATELDVVSRIADRAFAQMVAMIHIANNRKTKQPGDPKVGGHPAACASCYHVLGVLHLMVREPADYVACKPHASPIDHAYHHLMRVMRDNRIGGKKGYLGDADAEEAMAWLRQMADGTVEGEAQWNVFQSYHAKTDPDNFHFLPSGTVGIPPVNSIFLALAYRYAKDHGFEVPEGAHFWSLIGDSEFREGSLFEAMPDAAERQLGNVTWIIDYNRQNLDGTRTPNEVGLARKDCDRIEGTALSNGWNVIQLRHGRYREEVFAQPGGEALRTLFEHDLTDYEYQRLLFLGDGGVVRTRLEAGAPEAANLLGQLSDQDLLRLLSDLGGHDLEYIHQALTEARASVDSPTLIIAHTIKGLGLESMADPANHSSLPSKQEVEAILERNGLSMERPFEHFGPGEEADFLAQRGEQYRQGMADHEALIERNRAKLASDLERTGELPDSLGLDLSLFPMVHTQQMWGQIAAKLIRIGTHGDGGRPIGGASGEEKPLTADEERWSVAADYVLTMSPDVGTSTQIAPTMNARLYGPDQKLEDFGARHPELIASYERYSRHLRFEIAEANVMSAAGSFGMLGTYLGAPLMPFMTVYDFFIKRALDQLYYNLYWGSEFVILGTPSGVTLSPEGAQHSWKSDIQIPNLITWEPFFAQELDWITCDAVKRQLTRDNAGRSGVLIRGVTRSIPQKQFLELARTQGRFKQNLGGQKLKPAGSDWSEGTDESTVAALDDGVILAELRREVLGGAYRLIDYSDYAGYEPGDNVVQLFAMGSLATEAIAASKQLLELGIYADVIVVSSPELLCGILAHNDEYTHLKDTLGLSGDLHAVPSSVRAEAELVSLAARRVPIVSVHDGEPGLLDNLGSILGVKQVALATRVFSKCGRPDQVFQWQSIDAQSVIDACGQALSETALEDLKVPAALLEALAGRQAAAPRRDWRELWPERSEG